MLGIRWCKRRSTDPNLLETAVVLAAEDLEAMEETLFWQSQPGVHEDLEVGRATAREDLHDESDVRRRYGVGTSR